MKRLVILRHGKSSWDNSMLDDFDRPLNERGKANSSDMGIFLLEKIGERDWSGKTILEGNINGFFFTYNFLKKLPKDCLYVIIDKYGEVLERRWGGFAQVLARAYGLTSSSMPCSRMKLTTASSPSPPYS